MRIQDFTAAGILDKSKKGGEKIKGVVNSLFSEKLSSKESEIDSYSDDVESLRTAIDKAGNLLSAEPTLENFRKFRELLSTLVKRVNSEAYRLEKFTGSPSDPHYYETIAVINREADLLYSMIIRENRDSIAITDKVIGIKGLVVDLIT